MKLVLKQEQLAREESIAHYQEYVMGDRSTRGGGLPGVYQGYYGISGVPGLPGVCQRYEG